MTRFERKKGSTLREQLKAYLIREFATVPLQAKLPTDRELARLLDVSFVTVNKAMNELCLEGYVRRYRGKGTFLASHQQQVFRTEEHVATNGQIVVACPNYFSREYWLRIHAVEEYAVRHGMSCVEVKLNPGNYFEHLMEVAKGQKKLRALAIQPVPGSITPHAFDLLESLGCPVLICDMCPLIAESTNCVSVALDCFKVGYMEMKYMLDHGHRDVVVVQNEPPRHDGDPRIRGMRQALADYGIGPRSLKTVGGDLPAWSNSTEGSYRLTRDLLKGSKPTGLIYDSVAGAAGGLQAMWEQFLRAPDDISVIATGGQDVQEEYLSPALTVVTTDISNEMDQGLDVALGKTGQKVVIIEPILIERQSVTRSIHEHSKHAC